MAIAKKHFKKSSQQRSDDGIRLEERPHRVIIISANLSARPSMSSIDGAMDQSRDALCDVLRVLGGLCGKTVMCPPCFKTRPRRLALRHSRLGIAQPHWFASEAGRNPTSASAVSTTSAHDFETRRTRRSTKTPQRSVFDSSQGPVCLQGRREPGLRNALLRGPFVVLCVLCVSKCRAGRMHSPIEVGANRPRGTAVSAQGCVTCGFSERSWISLR